LERGIRRWLAVVLEDNSAMLRILEKFSTGHEVRSRAGGVIEAIYEIDGSAISPFR
jgi:hypothetical protein